MIFFNAKMVKPVLNGKKFGKTLDGYLQVQLRQAAREWLRAVIPRVPVYTGTARASLKPLGRFLRVAVPIRPVASRPGMGQFAGESQGIFEFKNERFVYTFTIGTGVRHYVTNEFYDVRPKIHLQHEPIPWQSHAAGQAAFLRYVNSTIPKRMPSIKDFLEIKVEIIRP
jgi:hypothetical protein